MSVILEDDQKFQNIFAALRRHPKAIGHLFGYPDGWDYIGGLDLILRPWISRLHLANCAAYNARYDGGHAAARIIEMDGEGPGADWNDFELIKALQSLSYQCNEAEGDAQHKESLRLLERIIYGLMADVIRRMPAYENAETW